MTEQLHCHCGHRVDYRVREVPPIYTVDFMRIGDGTPLTHCPACGTDLYQVLRAGPQEAHTHG